ncbi:MAG: hypothetical protein KDC80_20325 [Saprospiraceae bacterium]|nr:hypothetical protein [Saprospiraceae bacterium]
MVKFPFSGRQVLLSGIFLVLLFWGLNWLLPGLRSHWAFFPLWLGYILILNGWTQIRKGDSLLSRDLRTWLLLFLTSAPVWWIFEWLNKVAEYWQYLGVEAFTDLEYNIFATISFSTVIPAIFSTSEWLASFQFTNRFRRGIKAGAKRGTRIFFFILGWLMLAFFLYMPQYGAAFLWMSLYFILDPVNYWLGYPSLLKETAKKNWRTVLILWIASLICGFFWEMWNYFAYPKWIYEVPFVDFWYIFEMPLPGYLGYLPFALELYAMYHFILGILAVKPRHHFII